MSLPAWRRGLIVVALPAICLGLAGCGGGQENAASVVKKLGAVPIAYPPPLTIGTVRTGHFALLSMGDTVNVALPKGSLVQLTGHGPSFPAPKDGSPPPDSGLGTMEVTITGKTGTVTIGAGEFVGTNEQGQAVSLKVQPNQAIVGPGKQATMRLTGVFTTGDGALTYRPSGRPMVTWDFNVELD